MKKYLSGLLALLLAVSLSAFTGINKKQKETDDLSFIHFTYLGPTATYDDFIKTASWEIGDPGESCDIGEDLPCHVLTGREDITDVATLIAYLVGLNDEMAAEDYILSPNQLKTRRGD